MAYVPQQVTAGAEPVDHNLESDGVVLRCAAQALRESAAVGDFGGSQLLLERMGNVAGSAQRPRSTTAAALGEVALLAITEHMPLGPDAP